MHIAFRNWTIDLDDVSLARGHRDIGQQSAGPLTNEDPTVGAGVGLHWNGALPEMIKNWITTLQRENERGRGTVGVGNSMPNESYPNTNAGIECLVASSSLCRLIVLRLTRILTMLIYFSESDVLIELGALTSSFPVRNVTVHHLKHHNQDLLLETTKQRTLIRFALLPELPSCFDR